MNNSILEVKDLSCCYPLKRWGIKKDFFYPVKNLSFTINKGETTTLMGPSGRGKTTVAKVLWGLHPHYHGQIIFNGKEWGQHNQNEIQGVFQSPHDSLDPRQRVKDLLREAAIIHGNDFRIEDAISDLSRVGLNQSFLLRFPHELSGGECQRVVIARSLFLKAKLLILDEPTKALDLINQVKILELLLKIQNTENLSYLLITHDEKVAQFMGNQIVSF